MRKITVCWSCKSGARPLKRVTAKEKGKHKRTKQDRNLDYVCDRCEAYGSPPIANASFILRP